MKSALAGRPQPEFEPPPGLNLVELKIDTRSGKIAADKPRF